MRGIEALPKGLLEAMSEAGAYVDDSSARGGLAQIQTHISHLFLSANRVYKLRKAVDLDFLSFATRELRNADCLREVTLNRRLAPDVYLGIAPIVRNAAGRWTVGRPAEGLQPEEDGEMPEHCVVMRRLAADGAADRRIAEGRLEARHIDAVASRLARFHAETRLGTPAPFSADEWRARVLAPIRDTLDLAHELKGRSLDVAAVDELERLLLTFFEKHRDTFERRRREGRVVDGHGDLQLAHIWFEGDSELPLIIDCVEFDERLRQLDVAAELAFCAMDLVYRGRPDLGDRLLDRYARETDDYGLFDIIDFHIAHRSLIRAAVARIAAGEGELADTQRADAAGSAFRHLGLAVDRARAAQSGRGHIVMVCGVVGTGKSTVASVVAEETGGVVIASDAVRKHLAGLRPDERAAADTDSGIYTAEMTDRTYPALLERARRVVGSGRVAVLDATYSKAAQRRELRAFARELGVPVWLVEVRCDEAVVLERLAARRSSGRGASDAGPEMYRTSVERFESADGEPPPHILVETQAGDWPTRLRDEIARIARAS